MVGCLDKETSMNILFLQLKHFSLYLDASSDLFTVGESCIVGLCVLWGGLLWPLSLLLGIHPIQEDTLAPKHCHHHGQRPGPTPHLHSAYQPAPESLQNRPESCEEDQPCDQAEAEDAHKAHKVPTGRRPEECSFGDSQSKRLSD